MLLSGLYYLSAVIFTLYIPKSTSSVGSTPHLKDIVLGRCWEYQMIKRSNVRNCTAIWDVFYNSFAFKNSCSLTFADYEPVFESVKGQDIKDKALFWSGTYKAVHSYSDFDLRYTTLEDTFIGFMMNGLRWCGNPLLARNASDGIDYQSCPSCDIITAFWGQASKRFAERARGVIRVMVNGTRTGEGGKPIPAYSRSSFFGRYELPSLNVTTITKLIVVVIHTIDQQELCFSLNFLELSDNVELVFVTCAKANYSEDDPQGRTKAMFIKSNITFPITEKCGSGTIDLLVRDARSRGLNVVCKDDPDSVQHVLCTDYPQSRECLFLTRNKPLTSNDIGFWKTFSIVLMITSTVLLITTVVVTITWLKKNFMKVEDDTIVLT